jgi:hypothetical protein
MLDLCSITAVFFLFLLGYKFPRKAGWAVLIIAPVLGPSSFTFVPSTFLNLTTYRVAFAVTVGVILNNYNWHGIPLKSIFKSTFVKIVTVFSLFVIIISLEDRLKNLTFTYVPNLILAFALCFILIKDEEDLQKLVKIFVWQGAVIGALVIIEYFTDFNFNEIALSTVPGYDIYQLGFKNYGNSMRAGFYRCSGIDGSAVQTGYRLVFLLPLTLWYATKGKLWNALPVFIVITSFIFLQTRAVFVAIAVSLPVYIFFLIFRGRIRLLLRTGVAMSTVLVSLMVLAPSSFDVARSFIDKSLAPVYLDRGDNVQAKIDRIPVAIDYFLKKPLSGYGSPQYVYFVVMNTDDIPAPLIYLLAGGIPLCLIHLMLIAYMPYTTLRLSMSKEFSIAQRDIFMFSGIAFLCGVVCVFSYLMEGHFLVMYMLYISIYKVYLYRDVPGKPKGTIKEGNI